MGWLTGRWLAWALTPLCLVAVGWAGDRLWQVWEGPLPPVPLQRMAPTEHGRLDLPEPKPPMRWPALFGEYAPPEPQPPRPPAPVVVAEPQPPAPPIDSLGFSLRGVVSNGGTQWAIIAHPTGERLVRVGDSLTDGVTVTAIKTTGLELNNRGQPDVLGFQE